MKKFFILVFINLVLVFSACDQSDNESNPEAPEDLLNKSSAYFDGEAIQKIMEIEEGIEAWKITIQNNNGSKVKFYWTVNNGSLVKIEGATGPFNYEIQPGQDLINFSTAQTIASGAVKNDSIKKWELKQEEEFIDKWIYTFEFHDDGGAQKVYIDAEVGDILQID
jgi:uncharacterized membrane protein YkoI